MNLNFTKNGLLFSFALLFLGCQSVTQLSSPTIEISDVQAAQDFYFWTEDRIPMVSAHRGGPYPGFPENAIETFENVSKQTPAVIEFDVAISKDSVLVLMHDNTLERTTTGSGKVIDHTYAEL